MDIVKRKLMIVTIGTYRVSNVPNVIVTIGTYRVSNVPNVKNKDNEL